MKSLLMGLILFCALPPQAMASSTGAGVIVRVLVTDDDHAFFEQLGTRSAKPACVTTDRWVIDTSTTAGQALLAQILSAHATGQQVYISGKANCVLWGDSETVAGILTAD